MLLPRGSKLGPYEILEPVGAGGMGEVYRARDTRLRRTVAIKLLRRELVQHREFHARFQREARAISALNHPHVCGLYDIGQQDGIDYLVMEYVEGQSAAAALKQGPLPVEKVLRYAWEIADALRAAHARGIIHRDLKPDNVMINEAGIKVLDFGIAKRSEPAGDGDAATQTLEAETGAGHLVGTVGYMSPEQAEGRPIDARSDIFSLGVLLYEMLCGQPPFRGASPLATLASILREAPQSPRQLRRDIPEELERIVLRCLSKDPNQRYATAAELSHDLEHLRHRNAGGGWPRRRLVVALVLFAAVLGGVGLYWRARSVRARWAETEAVHEAARLMEHSERLAALTLVRQVEQYAPQSPELIRLKDELSVLPRTFETTPPGAEIYATDYADPRAADYSHWVHLGSTPLKTDRLPARSYFRIRALKAGFEPLEATMGRDPTPFQRNLHTKSETPPGMVWIPDAPTSPLVLTDTRHPKAPIPAAWMDRYEVSNRQYKEFVDAGGYQKRQYWKYPFVKDGKSLTWDEALAAFRDATGRPGPSTWEGNYPDGKAEFPVGGVSWYEAAAYAEFTGKSLPTLFHWYRAAGLSSDSQITGLSNFGGRGPARIGSNSGIAPYGAFDMAGNVKEWVVNSSGEKRYILGGGWNESSYMFQQSDLRSPWDREPTFGFRCVRYPTPLPDELNRPVITTITDRSRDQPVDDRTFEIIKGTLSYDKTDLKARVDSVDDASHWRRENISFQAAYGNERVIAHLYLPRDAVPPYQAVIYFGGTSMMLVRTPEEVSTRLMEYIVKSGRAVVLPAYAGTLERGPTPVPTPPGLDRDLKVQQFKDLARSIDYLETRPDIDTSKLGFYGLSYGTGAGIRALSIDPRYKVAVFVSAGVRNAQAYPVADSWNFAPRMKVPVLMLNGRDDSMSPLETSQKPMFNALGTAAKDKRHIVYPGGHVDFMDRQEVVKDALNWLDTYLGPVKLQP